MTNSRLLPGIILGLLSVFVGFVAGGMLGGVVAGRGSGLAGGATVFLWGLAGFLAALVLAIVLGRKLSSPHLWKSVIAAALLATLAMGWMAYRVTVVPDQTRPPLAPTTP